MRVCVNHQSTAKPDVQGFKIREIKNQIRNLCITVGTDLPQELGTQLQGFRVKVGRGHSKMVISNPWQGQQQNQTHLQPLL